MRAYQHMCCRCGMCCITTSCEVARERGAPEHGPCRYLTWTFGGEAECAIAVAHPGECVALGIGAGCCIKARAMGRNGELADFAGLPPQVKRSLAQGVLADTVLLARRMKG